MTSHADAALQAGSEVHLPVYRDSKLMTTIPYIVEYDAESHTGKKSGFSVICDLCFKRIGITVNGNMGALNEHRSSQVCLQKATKLAQAMPPPPIPEISASMSRLRGDSVSSLPSSDIGSYHDPESPRSHRSDSSADFDQTAQFEDTPFEDPEESIDTPNPGHPPCNGIVVEWEIGAPWRTYFFGLHDEASLPWDVVGTMEWEKKHFLRLVSTKCSHWLTKPMEKRDGACRGCTAVPVSKHWTSIKQRAAEIAAKPNTPWRYLNQSQLLSVLRLVRKQNRELRTMVSNMRRSLKTARRKLEYHQRIMAFLSEYDVPGLRRLFAVALRRGASPALLLARLEQCIHNMYRPHGDFSQRDYDIAFIAKALGGPRLLYALQKSFGLPSLTNLMRNSRVPELRACLAQPTEEEMSYNIETMFDAGIRVAPGSESLKRSGKVLMVDGIAMEEIARWDQSRDAVLACCREHGDAVDLSARDYEQIKLIEDALHGKKIHIGKDATVVALASITDPSDYLPIPVLVSASCKAEKGDGLKRWLGLFLDVWNRHPQGEAVHGPIMTIASDGESSFRSARFKLAMNEDIDVTTGFGEVLSQLKGLNLKTGLRGLLATCDPKHIWKRFATMIRNVRGIQIADATMEAGEILHELSQMPGYTLEEARDLMDPGDKMNVSKAVKLVEKLAHIEDHPQPAISSDASRVLMLSFFARTLTYFITPFTDVKMSLEKQLESLAVYAHVTYAMYQRHGLAFITGALYADSHSVVKHIFFTVARLQGIDPDLLYLIIHEGTDRLEGLFSNVRTQDHSRNFDLLQLMQKLSIAAELVATFQRHPEFDRGHRRRDLVDAEGIDHINPASVDQTNKRVGALDIPGIWRHAEMLSNEFMLKYLGYTYDFQKDWENPARDMMCPKGDGKYVGRKLTKDDLRSEAGHLNAIDEDDDVSSSATVDAEVESFFAAQDSDDEEEISVTVEGAYVHRQNDSAGNMAAGEGTANILEQDVDDVIVVSGANTSVDANASQPNTMPKVGEQHPHADDDYESDMDIDERDLLNGLEEWFVHEEEEDHGQVPVNDQSVPRLISKVIHNGVEYRKDSLIPELLRSDHARKTTVRTLRAGRVTQQSVMRQHGHRFEMEMGAGREDEEMLACRDLVGTLVHTSEGVSLIVAQILHLERAGIKRQLYDISLDGDMKDVTAVCQVVALQPHWTTIGASTVRSWIWERGYHPIRDASTVVNQKTHSFRVPVSRIYPLVPQLVLDTSEPSTSLPLPSSTSPSSTPTTPPLEPSASTTPLPSARKLYKQMLLQEDLENVRDELWELLEPSKESIWEEIATLPDARSSPKLPYIDEEGRPMLRIRNSETFSNSTQYTAKSSIPCRLCNTSVKLSAMRNHVGRHLLLHARGVKDRLLPQNAVIGDDPCGWCGKDGCRTRLIKKGTSVGTISNCDYHYSSMQYVHARQFSDSSPSTNVPIRCGLCIETPTTIWKYNAITHLSLEHRFLEDDGPTVPSTMLIDMRITRQEEEKWRIPTDKTDNYRFSNDIPNSDAYGDMMMEVFGDREETRQEMEAETQNRRRRARGESASTNISTAPALKKRR